MKGGEDDVYLKQSEEYILRQGKMKAFGMVSSSVSIGVLSVMKLEKIDCISHRVRILNIIFWQREVYRCLSS